ncbi:uncharacterized protein [Miscanthus floridulus]|uniref:uncharacterized protein n=1 Tax=Miscanthus floridulus TaxID=154761 RepID=UPI0034589E32
MAHDHAQNCKHKVIINGRPGPRIRHARGLRQGDPLSPLLFVIVMEVLNELIAVADRRGVLTPLPGNVIKFRASVYADDLVVFLAPTPQDFSCIREILQLFAGASGLQTNLDKCQVTPIRCSDEDVAVVQQVFPALARFNHSHIAWPIVCSPKDHGGLGIPDLKLLGFALRLRWEWLRRTDTSSAWALFPSRAEKNVDAMLRASVSVRLGDDAWASFWTDSWPSDGPISSFAPSPFQAVGKRRRNLTVKEVLAHRSWVQDITGAPTAPVLCDYSAALGKFVRVHLQPMVFDRFVCK